MAFENMDDTKAERRKTSISAAVGKEPKLSEDSANEQVMAAFNWYSYSSEAGDSKKYVLKYLKETFRGGEAVAKKLSVLKDWEFGATGWMARQLLIGCALPKEYAERFKLRLKELNEKAAKVVQVIVEEEKKVAKPVIVRAFTPRASGIIADLDGIIDDGTFRDDMYEWMSKREATADVLSEVAKYYGPYRDELAEMKTPKKADAQIHEAYIKIPKKRLKTLTVFMDSLMDAIERLKLNKKNSRKPRAKKAKSAIQQTKKLKYKQSDDTYKVTSIPPSDVVGTLQLWVFNTKTRKLGVYNASDTVPLSVKGTTIQGYNETSSVQKKVRKPEKALAEVLGANKVSLRKVMEGINAKASPLNGRINADTILLRSVK